MMKMKKLFKTYFGSFELTLKTIVLLLIPIATLFSIMSDRTPYNYFNIGIYGVLSVIIIFYVARYKTFKFDIFTVLVLVFNLTILVSQILNKRFLEYPRTILLLSAFSIIIYQFFINIDNKQIIFKLILFGGLAFAFYFVLTYRRELLSLNFAERLGDKFSDQNDLSKYLSLFGLISINYAIKSKKFWKIPYIFSAIIFVGIILITGSISNMLCFIICCLILFVINTKRQNRLIAILIIVFAIAVIYTIIQLPSMSYFKKRIEEIFNALSKTEGKEDGSTLERYALFSEALRLFFTRPLFGYGYDQVQYYTHSFGQFSHNNFTELGASFGVFGLIAYEVLLLMPLFRMVKNKKIDQNLLILTVYLFIFQIFLVIFRKKIEFVLMPLFFSISCYGYYSCVEVGIKNKRLFYSIVHSTKEVDEKTIESNQKMKVLFLFDTSESSLNHINDFYKKMNDVCIIKGVIVKNSTDSISNNFNQFQTYDISNKIFGYRKLSLAIDKFKPDVVYISGNLLNLRFLNCIGFTKKIVCYLNENFNEKTIFKKKSIKYVVCSKKDKDRLERLSKKKKYHATVIEQEYSKVSPNNNEYLCSFIGAKYLRAKYKEAVELFTNIHKESNESRFSIVCDNDSFKQLDEYFKNNEIDYIDMTYEQSHLTNVLTSSKSVLLLSSTKADSPMMDLYKMCGNYIIYKKQEVSSINEEEVDAVFDKLSDKKVIKKMLALKDIEPKERTLNDSEFSTKHYQYQYINLFML